MILEEEYNPGDLITGFNVYCETYNMSDTSDFELSIKKLKPSHIILYEPHLEVMRCIEVYNAQRVLDLKN
jgi:hypothetical protein